MRALRQRFTILAAVLCAASALLSLPASCTNDFGSLLEGAGGGDAVGAGPVGATGSSSGGCTNGPPMDAGGPMCGNPSGCGLCNMAKDECTFDCDVCGATCDPFVCAQYTCTASCGPGTTCDVTCDMSAYSCVNTCDGCSANITTSTNDSTFTCTGGASCDATCTADSYSCSLECIGSQCKQMCLGYECTAACQGSSECDVTCGNAANCDVTCAAGAKCVFTCDPSVNDCAFLCEGALPLDCGNNRMACHYDTCP